MAVRLKTNRAVPIGAARSRAISADADSPQRIWSARSIQSPYCCRRSRRATRRRCPGGRDRKQVGRIPPSRERPVRRRRADSNHAPGLSARLHGQGPATSVTATPGRLKPAASSDAATPAHVLAERGEVQAGLQDAASAKVLTPWVLQKPVRDQAVDGLADGGGGTRRRWPSVHARTGSPAGHHHADQHLTQPLMLRQETGRDLRAHHRLLWSILVVLVRTTRSLADASACCQPRPSHIEGLRFRHPPVRWRGPSTEPEAVGNERRPSVTNRGPRPSTASWFSGWDAGSSASLRARPWQLRPPSAGPPARPSSPPC